MTKIYKGLAVMTLLFMFMVPVLASAAIDVGINDGSAADSIGLGNKDPRDIAASIIGVVLGFLGILAVIIILIGGFKWMTAGGNEDQVADARKVIVAGIIGLAIILASWGIARFVLDNLLQATGNV